MKVGDRLILRDQDLDRTLGRRHGHRCRGTTRAPPGT